MKKRKLDIDFEYDFELLGISSSVKFYKLAWAINQKLNIRLVSMDDYELDSVKGKPKALFGYYSYVKEPLHIELFRNKSSEGQNQYLIPEFMHFDYVLKFTDQLQSFADQEIQKELKEVKWIEYISPLEVNNLKSKDNFLS